MQFAAAVSAEPTTNLPSCAAGCTAAAACTADDGQLLPNCDPHIADGHLPTIPEDLAAEDALLVQEAQRCVPDSSCPPQ